MTLNKFTFFTALFALLIGPFLLYKCLWIANSIKCMGTMRYVGKSYSGQIPHEFSVIRFLAGKDTIWFNTMDNFIFTKNESVPVRYQKNNPFEARVNTFAGLWIDTLIYISPFLLVIIICFLHPDLVPRRSRIWLMAGKPYVRVYNPLPGENNIKDALTDS